MAQYLRLDSWLFLTIVLSRDDELHISSRLSPNILLMSENSTYKRAFGRKNHGLSLPSVMAQRMRFGSELPNAKTSVIIHFPTSSEVSE